MRIWTRRGICRRRRRRRNKRFLLELCLLKVGEFQAIDEEKGLLQVEFLSGFVLYIFLLEPLRALIRPQAQDVYG